MENFNEEYFEKKLRIEYQVKKEFRDKNMEEWLTAFCNAMGIFALFCFIIIALKGCIGA